MTVDRASSSHPDQIMQRFKPPIEGVIARPAPIEVLGTSPPITEDRLPTILSHYEAQLDPGQVLGVYETTAQTATEIVEHGFTGTDLPTDSTAGQLHSDAFTVWLHTSDLGRRSPNPHPCWVFCALPIEQTLVRSRQSRDRFTQDDITAAEYYRRALLPFVTYLRLLPALPVDPVTHSDRSLLPCQRGEV